MQEKFNDRVTPENITELKENEVFVFGSNTGGRHGKGAAKTALKWGAVLGEGEGHFGSTYALPTVWELAQLMDPIKYVLDTMPLDFMEEHVSKFISYALDHPELRFLVTKVGCGLAGYGVEDIAPFFRKAIELENVLMPLEFWEILFTREVTPEVPGKFPGSV